MAEAKAIIECDEQFYIEISTHLQHAITGKNIFYSDSLVDLIARHCPEIYQMAMDKDYRLIPSDNPNDLEERPPHINFDIVQVD